MTIKHISELVHKKQQSEQSEHTSSKSTENDIYPEWINELFYKFSLAYGQAWHGLMPTEISESANKKLYFDALKLFNPETIVKAVDRHISLHDFPKINKLVSLCEEIRQTNRYNVNQLPEPEIKKTRMPEELRKRMGITRK